MGAFEFEAQFFLDWGQQEGILFAGETDRGADAAGAAGAADAVDVVVGFLGQCVIDYMGDVLDVQAAAGHVGRHQHLNFAGLELVQGAGALVLGNLAG